MRITRGVKGWHFVGSTLRDHRPVPKDGVWLKHKGTIELCSSGLHASPTPFDALQYAPGPILCHVECRGDFLHDTDKWCCTERKIIKRMDATDLLRYFACMQALSVIDLWITEPPDVVLDYLMTGDERLAASAASAAFVSQQKQDFNKLVYECFSMVLS